MKNFRKRLGITLLTLVTALGCGGKEEESVIQEKKGWFSELLGGESRPPHYIEIINHGVPKGYQYHTGTPATYFINYSRGGNYFLFINDKKVNLEDAASQELLEKQGIHATVFHGKNAGRDVLSIMSQYPKVVRVRVLSNISGTADTTSIGFQGPLYFKAPESRDPAAVLAFAGEVAAEAARQGYKGISKQVEDARKGIEEEESKDEGKGKGPKKPGRKKKEADDTY